MDAFILGFNRMLRGVDVVVLPLLGNALDVVDGEVGGAGAGVVQI